MQSKTLRSIKNRTLELMGIFDGEYAYKGPFHAQIDVTDECNNSCIACWCNSPLLKERRRSQSHQSRSLTLSMVRRLLADLNRLGTEEVYYSGGGEPFMHPQFLEILAETKRYPFTCFINTNFTLMDKQKLDFLIENNIDWLTVSTWAGTTESYVKTHPRRTSGDFRQIRDNLMYLNRHKRTSPRVKLYNVIFNMNYLEIEQMLKFASETGCEAVEFALVDTIPKATDSLALNEPQIAELRTIGEKIRSRIDAQNIVQGTAVSLIRFEHFLRRLSVPHESERALYDKNIVDRIPCYIGWLFSRIVPNGDVHPCLKAHRIPVGNLHRACFPEIWNSRTQRQFRQKTLAGKKENLFFRSIGNDPAIQEAGCYKSCDDIARNLSMYNRIARLPTVARPLFLGTMGTWAAARKILKK